MSRIILFLLISVLAVPVFAQTPKVEVKNEVQVNTDALEFSPTFYEDGIVLISTNNAGLKKIKDEKIKLNTMSILRSKRNANGELQAAEPFAKELTSQFHEGPVCFDRTAETVYFSRNNLVNGKEKIAKDNIQKMGLYMAKKTGGAWGNPEPLPFNNPEVDDCHPSLSIDGDKLFFASNRPGGQGGMDLWVSYRVGDSWSEPTNLGPEINGKGNEVFPFIHADNTLYFASTSHKGEGGLDMFASTFDDPKWATPVNLKAPFNSKGDDFGLIVDLNKINGYYTSSGQGGKGGDDIFSFHMEDGNLDDLLNQKAPVKEQEVVACVIDAATSAKMPGVEVRIISTDGSNVIGRDENGNLITIRNENGQDVMRSTPPDKGVTGTTGADGCFTTKLKPGTYVVIASQEGFDTKQQQIAVKEEKVTTALALTKAVGKVRWNASAFNHISNTPLNGAMFVLSDKQTGKRDTVYADANGNVDKYLNANSKYRVDVYQGGKIIGSTDIDTANWAEGTPMTQSISVAPLLPGTVIELPNIYYNFNDATLRPDARKDLDLVVALMRQHPSITVELASHTDSRGSETYNRELSQRRANQVVEYLVTQGISRNRLRPMGYGESEPRNRCRDGVTCSDQEHARNRRTAVRILTGVQGATFVYFDGNSASALGENNGTTTNNTGTTTTGTNQVYSSSDTEYYVVVGSFLNTSGAESRRSTVANAGFGETFVTQFPNSTFHSVCVGRFSNRRDADALRRRVERATRLDAFVRPTPRF
jgi:outer membrane protein OmpA-like peptidoglycan-associated protein